MSGIDPSRLFKCRVLVVEDDPLVRETTAAIVHSFGFSIRTAEDGFVALKILREVLPDIILCDLRMPGMSGFELLSIVRRRFPHNPDDCHQRGICSCIHASWPAGRPFLSKRRVHPRAALVQDQGANCSV